MDRIYKWISDVNSPANLFKSSIKMLGRLIVKMREKGQQFQSHLDYLNSMIIQQLSSSNRPLQGKVKFASSLNILAGISSDIIQSQTISKII